MAFPRLQNTYTFSWSSRPLYLHSIYLQPWGFPDSSVGKESICNAVDPSSTPGSGRFPGGWIGYPLQYSWASLVSQLVKNLPAMWKTWVRSLGWKDSPGEGKGYSLQYSVLENSMDCIVHGVAKSRTQLSDFHLPMFSHAYYWVY